MIHTTSNFELLATVVIFCHCNSCTGPTVRKERTLRYYPSTNGLLGKITKLILLQYAISILNHAVTHCRRISSRVIQGVGPAYNHIHTIKLPTKNKLQICAFTLEGLVSFLPTRAVTISYTRDPNIQYFRQDEARK